MFVSPCNDTAFVLEVEDGLQWVYIFRSLVRECQVVQEETRLEETVLNDLS